MNTCEILWGFRGLEFNKFGHIHIVLTSCGTSNNGKYLEFLKDDKKKKKIKMK